MKLFRSLSFRLALLYAALFCLSVLLLGGLYYAIAIRAPLAEVRSGLVSEARQFEGLYRAQGAEAVARRLERRAGDPTPRAGYHALLDSAGRPISANLPSWPQVLADSWIRIEADVAREGDEDEHEALVRDLRLFDGGRLLLGRDVDDLDELEEAIKDTLIWLLPALILLSMIGGALMSRAIGGRIESVASAARAVIGGDHSQRVPLRGTDDDFDRLGETLNLMLDRIEEALDSVRRVSDSVAHELRTPLTRLRASLTELDHKLGSDDIGETLQEAARLETIFNAVLRISRIEAAMPIKTGEKIDLQALLTDAAEFYQPEADQKGQYLDIRTDPGLFVLGDRDLIFQAVANLLDNAVKFGRIGGNIAVEGVAAGERARIVVEDQGPGIPAEHRGRVTERFFRAPNGKPSDGAGLGLALVAAIATYHRSELRFSAGEDGLRVEWTLPRDCSHIKTTD